MPDGTVIEAGETVTTPTAKASVTPLSDKTIAVVPLVGFPGLSPVDFTKVAKIPVKIGAVITGAISPTGGEILGYVFDGKVNSTQELTFTRLSGNLNLGLVVLSDDNKVLYQASLITSMSMVTTFTISKDEKFTVGIFKIDLLPPASPEPTAFAVQITQ